MTRFTLWVVREGGTLVLAELLALLRWFFYGYAPNQSFRSTGFSLDVKKNLTIPEGTVR